MLFSLICWGQYFFIFVFTSVPSENFYYHVSLRSVRFFYLFFFRLVLTFSNFIFSFYFYVFYLMISDFVYVCVLILPFPIWRTRSFFSWVDLTRVALLFFSKLYQIYKGLKIIWRPHVSSLKYVSLYCVIWSYVSIFIYYGNNKESFKLSYQLKNKFTDIVLSSWYST